MQENQFLLFPNHLRLPYSIPKSFALLLSFHCLRHTSSHFKNGILKIDIAVDDYFGRIFEISINGVAKYIGETHYKEFP